MIWVFQIRRFPLIPLSVEVRCPLSRRLLPAPCLGMKADQPAQDVAPCPLFHSPCFLWKLEKRTASALLDSPVRSRAGFSRRLALECFVCEHPSGFALSHALHLVPAARILDVAAFAVCVQSVFQAPVSKLPAPSAILSTHGSLPKENCRVSTHASRQFYHFLFRL